MKRSLKETIDHLDSYFEAKQNLESAHKRQRIFTHPTAKSKLLRQHMYQYIDNHNANIDADIHDEINKLICILKDIIIENNIKKLQQLISYGILDEINNFNSCENTNRNDSNSDMVKVVTEIIGCVLQYNREECLLIIAPFIECKHFDINKFDRPILEDPLQIILFLHSKAFIDLMASHCKLFHKCVEYGHYESVKYCLNSGVPVDSCSNRAIRDAARGGHLKIVQLLHEKGGNLHEYQDECLRKAARYGHLNVMKYCIQHKADIDAKHSESLLRCIENGHVECADLLIKSGLQKHKNFLITNTAIKHQQYDCLSLLLRYGYVLFDAQLRSLALIDLYGEQEAGEIGATTIAMAGGLTMDMMGCYDTESSPSPPLSPQCLSPTSSLSSISMSPSMSPFAVSPTYSMNDDFAFEHEADDQQIIKQRFLEAISEGVALRETMLISLLTPYVYDQIASMICSFEKLALTEEDEMMADEIKSNKNAADSDIDESIESKTAMFNGNIDTSCLM
eukprot:CAMPEP_0197032956 /NCGR_PEP_ID=MMETSP1384-20130603/11489_1 /TAXON_ID=29189 /ORGANISM="Ammonia sp." /LENGTH=507 /DNA_ID=CAMNT_0042462689 /DNA_START=107 /DNA_END=1631 /DNA_ORIENTATION=+